MTSKNHNVSNHSLTEHLMKADISEILIAELRNGSAKSIARYFSTNLSLSILSEDGLYSKFQAEMILTDFFSKNKPTSVKLVQKITNNSNYNYFVYSLTTNKGLFRVFLKVGAAKNANSIEEFRIEKQSNK